MNQHPFGRDFDPLAGSRRRHLTSNPSRSVVGAIALAALSACGDDNTAVAPPGGGAPSGGGATSDARAGERLFSEPFPNTNGRSCATCHVPEDNFTLTPAHVAGLLETNPDDPLFNAIDADDPNADTLTFEHLKKGLIRVGLTLPDNMDLIDDEGNVTTPPDRTLFVWRGVPSIANSAMSEPFQLDGRVATLEEQAQGAVTGHSQGGTVAQRELQLIAAFERDLFSSPLARSAAEQLARGVAPEDMPELEMPLLLSPAEARGREIYRATCEACHGGVTTNVIVDREIHDLAFPALKPDGTVLYQVPATDPPTPMLAAQPENEFLNIGSAYQAMQGQFDPDILSFTKDVSFPNYRYRFYTDASRTEIAADLPPVAPPFDDDGGFGRDGGNVDGGVSPPNPVTAPNDNELDPDGNPVTGPNLALQWFSTDPGRAVITGSPNDFEAFDVPTLRGIAKTAPYFHNNIAETLERVADFYSDHFLARFPSLTLPGEKEPDPDGDAGPPEALTLEQKSDLVAFLKLL
jgi:cytochrome c peroxidase